MIGECVNPIAIVGEGGAAATAVGDIAVGLLTGGTDKHYAVPLACALADQGVRLDFIGSDDLDCREVRNLRGLTFLNLRRDQREDVSAIRKASRVLAYYVRLVRYAAVGKPNIFHILWQNKFETFDRTLLMLYYRLVGKRLLLTAHNVNARKRDFNDGWINRLSLRIQYRLCDHIFVHTERMKTEIVADFGVRADAVSVIPYGINTAVPTTGLTAREARRRLGLAPDDKAVLFFGVIAPYKGLEHLVAAMKILADSGQQVRLVIAGKVGRGCGPYWTGIQQALSSSTLSDSIVQRVQWIEDSEIEAYFMAADAVVLPYTTIFQSGVAFLAYSFGVPLIATDVGSLREDVIDGRTGFLCRPEDPQDLARAIGRYFSSALYGDLQTRREEIRRFITERHSWTTVAEITAAVYRSVAGSPEYKR